MLASSTTNLGISQIKNAASIIMLQQTALLWHCINRKLLGEGGKSLSLVNPNSLGWFPFVIVHNNGGKFKIDAHCA